MPKAAEALPGWTMPVTPMPISGESWRSFLRRAAALNDTTVSRLVEACGITDDDILNPAQRRSAAQLVGLDEADIREMTLNAWTGSAFASEPRSTANRQGPAWTWLAPTFHCTACLGEGVELLEWRLPWITTCVTHETYLTCRARVEQALAEDLERDARHLDNLGVGRVDGYFDIWRDAVRLVIGLRRYKPTRSDAPASDRARVMSIAAPLATAESAEERASVLADWCQRAGVRVVWDALSNQLCSRPVIDATDALAAREWFRRRALAGVAG